MIEKTPTKSPKGRLGVTLTIAGSLVGLLALLFAAANADWVIIRIPSAPWSSHQALAAFEARLWGIMLVCLVLGALCSGLVFHALNKARRRRTALIDKRLKELETELKNVGRLVATTRKGTQ